jgi:UPF0755 protein
MKRLRRFGFVALLLLFVISVTGVFAYRQINHFADASLVIDAHEPYLEVKSGSSLTRIAYELRQRKITSYPISYWRVLAWQMNVAQRLHAGEYKLDPGMTPRVLLARMAKGDVVQYNWTIIEGWDFRTLRQSLAKQVGVVNTIQNKSDDDVMQMLGAQGVHSEGRFLPETYAYTRGMRDLDLLKRAYLAMRVALDKAWSVRDLNTPLQSPDQLLVLASIVEKETGQANERARIAGVFLRRLKIGMRLQTDPTVIYGLGDAYAGNLTRQHLETDTPYNTYTRSGLPPTPIAMSGEAALHAAAKPEMNDRSLYFVARGDGSHHFSATLSEHVAAVAQYQLRR